MRQFFKYLSLLMFCFPLWAGAATYWVDLSGTGTGAANGADVSNLCAGFADADCTPSAGDTVNACNVATNATNISTAGSAGNVITYNYACSGGTAGRYAVSGASAALTLGSAGAYQTHVSPTFAQTGTASCVLVNGADNIVISGATFSECGAQGISISATADSDALSVLNSTFANIDEGCISLIDSTLAGTLSAYTITGNTFSGCNTDANTDRQSIRLSIANASTTKIASPTISNNAFAGNTAASAMLIGYQTVPACAAGSCDTRQDAVTSPTIANNTVTSGFGGFSLRHLKLGTISENSVSGTTGATGGFVIFYSTGTVVEGNLCSNMSTTTIDGGCVDIDHGNSGVVARQNECWDIVGKSGVENSGYCIMVLDAVGSKVYSNLGGRNKYGIFLGNNQGLTTPVNEENNNAFNSSLVADVWMTTLVANNIHALQNNSFVASAGYAVNRQGSVDQTMNYNHVYAATSGSYNGQTAGANDVTSAPLFVGGTSPTTAEGFRLRSTSPLIGAGTCIARYTDYFGNWFKAPTCDIGAHSYTQNVRTTIETRN